MTLFEKSQDIKSLVQVRELIGTVFSKIPLAPNQWTGLSLRIAFIAAFTLASEMFFIAAFLFLIAGFLDVVDGAVARSRGMVTKWGAYLDTITDRYMEFLLVIPLFFIPLPQIQVLGFAPPLNFWIAVYLFGAMMTTYAKATAKEKELGIPEIRGGVIERAERVALLIIGILAAGYDLTYLSYMVVLLAVLANISALQRIRKVHEAVHEEVIDYKPPERPEPRTEIKKEETPKEQPLEGLKVAEEKEKRKYPFAVPEKKKEEQPKQIQKKLPPPMKI